MKSKKRDDPFVHVQRLIKKLPTDQRQALVPFLASLPDSGLKTYDAKGEAETLKQHGARINAPNADPTTFLVGLTVLPNLVSADIAEIDILRARFFPDNFVQAYPIKFARYIKALSKKFQEGKELRGQRRANLEAQGIHQSETEFEDGLRVDCDEAATVYVVEKGKRIAERLSLHLPGMVGDMLAAALKGETFYDYYESFKSLKPEEQPPAVKDFKKLISRQAVASVTPHLPSTRHIRTPVDWRGDDVLARYADRVNERRVLSTTVKDKFIECEGDDDWVFYLNGDSNYQKLVTGVPPTTLKRLIRRAADTGLSDRERQPLPLALDIARNELGLSELDIETLDDKYNAGVKILKAKRAQEKS